jgi:Tol biopolymer transport system component
MTPERWEQIDKLLESVLELELDRREDFLARACASDRELRQEVEALLEAHQQAESFIQPPALGATATKEMSGQRTQSWIGQQMGNYKILSLLGSGGMGEVYLAEDRRLGRKIALKFLPARWTADKDRVRRFEREARAASALNHPNIVTIHEVGEVNGTTFMATEFIDGQTLRERMQKKRLEVREILDIGIQVASALAAAHESHIVHRDIKPENIMLRRDGYIKVLDFGLAKLIEPHTISSVSQGSAVATLLTETAMIIGTAQYMSPEQVLGKELDQRTDLFSLGAVLYEMVTGTMAFKGNTSAAVCDAILHGTPDSPRQLNSHLSGDFEAIIRKALEKDSEVRFQTAVDLRADLKRLQREVDLRRGPDAFEVSGSGARDAAVPTLSRRWALALVSGLLASLAAVALAVWLSRSFRKPDESPMTALPLTTYPGHERNPSFSPDGSQVAFSWNGDKQDNFDIYVKLIGADPPLRLTSDRAEDSGPAWSPDGRWIAFLRDLGEGKAAVLLVPPIGGSEKRVGEVHRPWFSFGFPLAWSPEGDSLVVVDRESDSEPYGLYVLSLESGEKRKLTSPPALTRGDGGPAFSPDGRAIAFVRTVDFGSADLYLLPIGEGLKAVREPKKLTSGRWQVNNPAWAPSGRDVIFSNGLLGFGLFGFGTLWRVSATVSGEPQQLAVGENGFGLCISRQRHRLVYSRELSDINIWRVDISGQPGKTANTERFIFSTRDESTPQISPDGKKIAFSSNRSGSGEIWICDYDGSGPVPLTSFGKGQAGSPRWSPDSQWLSFDSDIEGQFEIYRMDVRGGKPQRLTWHPARDAVPSWSRDGQWIYFGSNRDGTYQVWKMPASGGEPAQVTRKGGFVALESLDGKSVYYTKGYDDRHIWKVSTQGGEEVEVLGPILWRDFDVAKNGIYFIATPDWGRTNAIRFFSFASGEVTSVASIESPWANYISVSPDGRWILYPKLDLQGSDLMLVENFR